MKPRRFSDCIDPEFEQLMAEVDPNVQEKFEEIETISSGINVDTILSGDQSVRMPSGTWKQVKAKGIEF